MRLLLETNTGTLTAAELEQLVDAAGRALGSLDWLLCARRCHSAAIRREFLRTAAALFGTVLRPLPPYLTAMRVAEPPPPAPEHPAVPVAAAQARAPADNSSFDESLGNQNAVYSQRTRFDRAASSSSAVAHLAHSVREACRQAMIEPGSRTGANGTDTGDPMSSLFLKDAALLYCGPVLERVLRHSTPGECSSPHAIVLANSPAACRAHISTFLC